MWKFVKKFSKANTYDALEKYLKMLSKDTRDAYILAFSRHPEIAKGIIQKFKKRTTDKQLPEEDQDAIMMELLADEEDRIFDIAAAE
jgi:hypothetical protein